MAIERTRFAYDAIRQHFEAVGADVLIENFCVQYLVVSLYSEMEKTLAEIISKRLERIEDGQVASFILKTNDAMIKRVRKAEINDLLKKFGCDELIEDAVENINLQPYFDAINNRHLVTHGDGCKMTFRDFEKVFDCVEMIVGKVKAELGVD